ncbi:1966_t:CDS:2, partial [Cetraspora pellucida]
PINKFLLMEDIVKSTRSLKRKKFSKDIIVLRPVGQVPSRLKVSNVRNSQRYCLASQHCFVACLKDLINA